MLSLLFSTLERKETGESVWARIRVMRKWIVLAVYCKLKFAVRSSSIDSALSLSVLSFCRAETGDANKSHMQIDA